MWRDYFKLTRNELLGYIAVMLLAAVVLIVTKCLSYFRDVPPVEIIEEEGAVPLVELFVNDTLYVNSATMTQLKYFGFSNFEAVNIMMYRDAGGIFENFEDLMHIYGIDTLKYVERKHLINYSTDKRPQSYRKRNSRRYAYDNRVEYKSKVRKSTRRTSLFYTDSAAFAQLGVMPEVWDTIKSYRERYVLKGSVSVDSISTATPDNIGQLLSHHIAGKKKSFGKRPNKSAKPKLEINSATADDLCKLSWVKQKTAARIIELRDKLGGFVDVEQLKEVYSIDEERYSKIAPQITVDAGKAKKLKINRCSENVLLKHPYISRTLARKLYRYRKRDSITSEADFIEACGDEYHPHLEKYIDFETTGPKQKN